MTVVVRGPRGGPGRVWAPGWPGLRAGQGARGQVSVAIVSDRTMKALNKRFRRVNKATDVLSFPTG